MKKFAFSLVVYSVLFMIIFFVIGVCCTESLKDVLSPTPWKVLCPISVLFASLWALIDSYSVENKNKSCS